MSKDSLEEIASRFRAAERICLYPHENMDGDALGSCIALCIALRKLGKDARILIDEKIPDNLGFLDRGYAVTQLDDPEAVDISVCVDCGDRKRLGSRAPLFDKGRSSICIDHHATALPFCELNHIDPDSAATGQLVFALLKAIGTEPDAEIGNALFAAITTDTGNFQYSNTQKRSHEIVAELYDWGITPNAVSIEIYESNRMERMLVENKALSTLASFCGGRAAIAYVTQSMLDETGADLAETEGIVAQIRAIKGVEVAIFLKEAGPSTVKASLRSKEYFDVARLAGVFDGGGHVRAAGFTVHCSLEYAFDMVKAAVEKQMEEY